MNKPTYQLTKHSVGSLREIWAISWPLILSLFSFSLMLFTDRLLLSRYSITDLNSAAAAGTALYMFIVLPLSIAAISEVFVGRYHGEDRHHELGKPVWQMVWFSLMLAPLFLLFGFVFPSLLFYDSPNIEKETTFFFTLIVFAPLFFVNVAIAGFFIGSGRVMTVTICSVLANLLNIVLDYAMIYGYGPIPSLGIFGAALATGFSETFQVIFLICIFLKKSYRERYGTNKLSFNLKILKESLRIGFPAGLGITVELFSHFIFFRIMAYAGQENLTIAAMIQSLIFLVFFLYEGLSKGVTTVCANLLGGKQVALVKKVLRSALSLQTLFFVIVATVYLTFSDQIIDLFLNQQDEKILVTPAFITSIKWGCLWCVLFFLFDGYTRVIAGLLTAAGDTKFLLYAGTILNIAAYVLPLLLIVFYAGGGADDAWMIIFCYSVTIFLVYYWRYRSERWMTSSRLLDERSN
ncbi:MAG: MATE family efflux transporter [Chlamydiota bacterium]